MSTLKIRTEKNENTKDNLSYHFTRSGIDYSVFFKVDCVDVWKTNKIRGTISNDRFWNGINNQGKPMAKFLKMAIELINS